MSNLISRYSKIENLIFKENSTFYNKNAASFGSIMGFLLHRMSWFILNNCWLRVSGIELEIVTAFIQILLTESLLQWVFGAFHQLISIDMLRSMTTFCRISFATAYCCIPIFKPWKKIFDYILCGGGWWGGCSSNSHVSMNIKNGEIVAN